MGQPQLTSNSLLDSDFEYLNDIILSRSGVNLGPNKKELLENRLATLIRKFKYKNISTYVEFLRTLPSDDPSWQELINVITTNKTDFFRENQHFEYITKELAPRWLQSSGQQFKVWSAACSTGEEPYSLAMVLSQLFANSANLSIIASDIDTKVLSVAKNGVYRKSQIDVIPEPCKRIGISYGLEDISEWVKIRKKVKSMVDFCQVNLAETPYKWRNHFDLILCRNVMIYFNKKIIEDVAQGLFEAAAPGCNLLIGHSESFQDIKTSWTYIRPSVFEKKIPPKTIPKMTLVETTQDKILKTSVPETPPRKKRVLVVDDSRTIQELLTKILNKDPQLEVIGVASNATDAEKMIYALKPNVVTLDINMPGIDGITLLQKLMKVHPLPIVMISSMHQDQAQGVFNAMALGAVDYIQKPSLAEMKEMTTLICEKVRVAADANIRDLIPDSEKSSTTPKEKIPPVRAVGVADAATIVAIGASTGGTRAIQNLLTQLPDKIPPILIVQHIPGGFSRAFADRLNELCHFTVKEAANGDMVEQNTVLIAPGGSQMKVVHHANGRFAVKITDDPPVNRHKPSVDYLFDSVAEKIGKSAIGIILTGMGADGAQGLLRMKKAGSKTIAEDEASCVVFGMPKEAIAIGAAGAVCPLDNIPQTLMSWVDNKTHK